MPVKERTPKEFVANMKRKDNHVSQTKVVLSLMDAYPDLSPKMIHEITGIKRGTIYTIQSRVRNEQRRTPSKTVDTNHLDGVATIKGTNSQKVLSKQEVFNRLTNVYLEKIVNAKEASEAEKYNKLLIQLMEHLDK